LVVIALLLNFRNRQVPSNGQALSALSQLGVGKTAVVEALDLPVETGHHLMHMGFVPEARVIVVRRAPAGDPTVYSIDGFEIALRRETAQSIRVREIEGRETEARDSEAREPELQRPEARKS
jgi:ferrous iron transport protein A